jgi:transposase
MVLDVVRDDEVCRRLMTIPGVGAITALTFKTGVDMPGRFAKSKTVGAHFGLTPRKFSSGEIDYQGRISKCGDAMVRSALYEAANVMLTRCTRWSALKAWAARIAKKAGAKRARVALARKLAVIMHRMWIDGTDFQWGEQTKAAR